MIKILFIIGFLTRKIFPKLETLYLASHPCEPIVLGRLEEQNITTYLHESYAGYLTRWNFEKINVISHKDYISFLLNEFDQEKEPLRFRVD